jgi:hypothetical protein
MHLELAVAEIREASLRRFDLELSELGVRDLQVQPLVAKLRQHREILDPRPARLIVENHVVRSKSDQEQSAALAERVSAHRPIEDGIAVRDMTGHEGAVEPLQGLRRHELAREIQVRGGDVAVVDGIRHGQHGGGAVVRLMPGDLAVHRHIARMQLEIGSGDEELLRVAPPVHRGLEQRKRDGLRKLIRPVEHSGIGVEDHVSRPLVTRQLPRQAAQARGMADRRKADLAEPGVCFESP